MKSKVLASLTVLMMVAGLGQSAIVGAVERPAVPRTRTWHYVGTGDSRHVVYDSLHLAALFGDVAEVRRLLDEGADINGLDEHGYTPLAVAIMMWNQNVNVIGYLLERGADPNIPLNMSGYDPGTTPYGMFRYHAPAAFGTVYAWTRADAIQLAQNVRDMFVRAGAR